VAVVVVDGETAQGHGELFNEEYKPGLPPGLAVRHSLATVEGPSLTAGY
jgi:hypothetical protein